MARPEDPARKPGVAEEDDGFLSRWSRRKAEAKAAAVDDPDPARPETPGDISETPDQGEAPALDLSSLPDIDSLGPTSDFSMFMQAGVPPSLKTRALRRLWQVKPELANLDGLIDYGEDLTGSFKAVDHLKTAYEVGRGFLKDEAPPEEPDGEGPPEQGGDALAGDAPADQADHEDSAADGGADQATTSTPNDASSDKA